MGVTGSLKFGMEVWLAMEMAVARLGVTLPGPEVVRAGPEVARAMTKYNSNLFWAMGRDWKS